MKKLFAAIITAFLAISCVFADESTEVKQIVIRDFEYTGDCNFSKMLEAYSKDYIEIDVNGVRFTYHDCVLMRDFFEKGNTDAFLYLMVKVELGRDPNAQEKRDLQKYAKTLEAKAAAKEARTDMKDIFKKCASLNLKTLKFIDLDISDENYARVIVDYSDYVEDDETMTKTKKVREIFDLRKENGVWKIYNNVDINIK